MAVGKIKIATCQFAVGKSIKRNAARIEQFLHRAKKARADIVHFSECALSGYAGVDLASVEELDWQLLLSETRQIMQLAKQLKLWIVLGSTHELTMPNKPHNSLYLISPQGRIIDRYDKRFCTAGDLDHYSPGNRFAIFNINGVRCALLICFDLRFGELYRELKKRKVDCVIQSFYNARQDGASIHSHIIRQTMQCRGASNHFWISMANSSAYYSPYPSCFIQPDGKIVRHLQMHRPGMMVNIVDLSRKFYDPMGDFRNLALKGILTNGPKINDPRSKRKTIV